MVLFSGTLYGYYEFRYWVFNWSIIVNIDGIYCVCIIALLIFHLMNDIVVVI